LLGSRIHSFANGNWNFAHEGISIFDAEFVSENVYAGSTVETTHRKNLFNFALGTVGVKLAQRIDNLTLAITDDGKEEKLAAAALQKHIVGATSLDGFASLPDPSENIEAELSAAKLELKAQAEASTLRNLQPLTPIGFEGHDEAALQDFLSSSLISVSADAATRLRTHRASAGVTEEWLIEGFEHCKDGSCPFCAQRLDESKIIPAYEACFSEAYAEHRRKLGESLAALRTSLSAEAEAAMRRAVELNESRITGWRQFLPEIALPFDFRAAGVTIAEARSTLASVSNRKMIEPTTPITLQEEDARRMNAVRELVTRVDDYNAVAVDWDKKISELKRAAESPDVPGAQAKVDRILCRIARGTEDAKADVAEWQKRRSAKKEHEGEKAQAREALDKYSADIPVWLIKSVNEHLRGCATYFKLASIKHVYDGATPRFEYVIEMRGRPVDLTGKVADDITFGTALSQGDKSALAFAFFLARLENDPALSEQTIVFDDPLSSLDSCRRRYTRKKIAELAEKAEQLILLTHEEATVADVAELLTENACCLLQFKEKADFTVILGTSVKELTASEYLRCFDRMQHFVFGDGIPESVVKDVRPYLEMNLRYRFPEHLGPEPLGKMIGQIRSAGSGSSLHRLQSQLKVLDEINDYCTGHSHGDGALENVEKILASDLKLIINSALEFGRGYPLGAAP
jgi:wobble nucleotide-excising tRNase